MEKGFSKSAPKLWCFSSHVLKFQNHSGAVVNHKLPDSEEFGDFLLCRLFVLMGNLLFQGGCGGNPNWCMKASTLWKIMQVWSRICRTAALVGLITNWADSVGRERKPLSYDCSKIRKGFERTRALSHVTSSVYLRCHLLPSVIYPIWLYKSAWFPCLDILQAF